MDERERAGVRREPPRLDDGDDHPGLAEQIADPLRLPERLGGDEHLVLRGDGDEARTEDGEPSATPRRSRAVSPKPSTRCRRSAASRRPLRARRVSAASFSVRDRSSDGRTGNPAASGPRSPSATTRCAGEQREQGWPRLRLERGQQPERRLVAVGALRPDVEGAQRRHAACLVLDPDGVLARPPGRRRSGPAAARTRRRPRRPERAGTPSRRAAPRETPARPRPPHAGRSPRRSATRRRKPARAPPRGRRRRPRHPRRRSA